MAFRFIAADEHPDHDTIATFRRRFLRKIEGLLVQVLLLAREMGMLKLGTVGLDGAKVHANASRHSALSYEHAGKIEAQLKAQLSDLLARAEAADRIDVPNGMSIPDELARREERLRKLAEARAKIAPRAAKAKAIGKKPGGKPPAAGPGPTDQINLTDEDPRIMPVAGGGSEQSYNAQAAVAAGSLLVVAADVVQAADDKWQLEPMLGKIAALPAAPDNPTPVEAMAHRLRTPQGKKRYALRKQTPEPVFGIIKSVLGCRQFLLRGLANVRGEWSLVTMAWNMKRMFALSPAGRGGRPQRRPAPRQATGRAFRQWSHTGLSVTKHPVRQAARCPGRSDSAASERSR